MSQMPYQTVAQMCSVSFTEKRSEFIGYLAPAQTSEEAVDFIARIRQQHWDATHNVYAYILRDGGQMRYSDDGEPSGTAGVPVLEVLQKRGLQDVCAVVTRYFGGILLGAGGLIRAYAHTASLAVDAAQILHIAPCTQLVLETDYAQYGKINYLLPQYSVRLLDSDFGVLVRLTLLLPSDRTQAFEKALTDLTNGTVRVVQIEQKMDFI